MLEVADIFRQYGGEYLAKYRERMLPSHLDAFQDILDCRTPALGGQVFACTHCGEQHYAYHSCRNRSCPKCHRNDIQAWLDKRRQELLPVPYFHIVFTLPQELGDIVRRYQKTLYPLLMKAAAHSLIKLAADPHYVGGLIGVLAVLHTWTRTLTYHPHVHCLVPGGGLSSEGEWLPARKDYLLPVRALSRVFRGVFKDVMFNSLPELRVPPAVWTQDWVVYCKPSVQGADAVLNYLARYVHRIAITNSRIVSIDAGSVTFRYPDRDGGPPKTLTLSAEEFIRRFLQHVLPSGVHKVRYYGLWAPSYREQVRRLQQALGRQPRTVPLPKQPLDSTTPVATSREGSICPHCHEGVLRLIGRLSRQRRVPP
jgi:hypothetical protein